MDKNKLNKLINFIDFLGHIVNKNVEIALHIIEGEKTYIPIIVNGHVSLRDKDAPLTDLAKSFIENEIYKEKDYFKNYVGYTKDKRKIKGSTYFIKSDENELEGMICFNIDVSKYEDLFNSLSDNLNINLSFLESFNKSTNAIENEEREISLNNFTEYYTSSIEDTVYSIVPKKVIESQEKLKYSQKMDIIRALYLKGLFNVKGTINEVSKLINTSVSSIYRYISEIENFD